MSTLAIGANPLTSQLLPRVTPEELLSLPDAVRYELVDGQLVERNMGTESSWVGGGLVRLLANFTLQHRLGWVLPADASYKCFPDEPEKVRKPDVSFIRFGRLPGEQLPLGHCLIAPDLAVEVVSPNDLVYVVEDKVEEYLGVGVRLVWVINPNVRTVRVYRLDRSFAGLRESDTLSGEQVIPGFECQVQDLFPPRQALTPTPAPATRAEG